LRKLKIPALAKGGVLSKESIAWLGKNDPIEEIISLSNRDTEMLDRLMDIEMLDRLMDTEILEILESIRDDLLFARCECGKLVVKRRRLDKL